jgi:hypothetical protein
MMVFEKRLFEVYNITNYLSISYVKRFQEIVLKCTVKLFDVEKNEKVVL